MNTLPINLLLENCACLVVGGGKVALRKIGHLLDAQTQVTVVCPTLCEEVAELVSFQKVSHIAREFAPADVENMTVVFAATNDRYINRQVLEACRERRVLCCCVDGNWDQSDFTTPAITRHGGVTVTVSTGGQSCRQAKLIKDNLAKHLMMVETADLVVVGTDHHHMDIAEREPFHLTGQRLERTGWMIMQLWGIHEFMILNTCNRIEIIAVASRETSTNGILRHVLGFDKLKTDQFYLKQGAAAFEHLCMVSAGMLSQTPGESHIAAQLKEALVKAQQSGWAGSMMQEWVSVLLHVSKHIQTEVAPKLRIEEIETLAVNYLRVHVAHLSEKTVLVLGAGQIGRGLVQEVFPAVGKIIWCYHIQRPDLSAEWMDRVELCTFNELNNRLAEADCILSATESAGHVLRQEHLPFFHPTNPILLIDLGVPRNIEPALDGRLTELRVVDLDGLKYWHRSESVDLNEIFSCCRQLIGEHRDQYERIIKSFQGVN